MLALVYLSKLLRFCKEIYADLHFVYLAKGEVFHFLFISGGFVR